MSLKAGTSTSPASSKTVSPGVKAPPPGVKEFTVKLARDIKKKYNVMQFNRGDKIDFSKTKKVVMDRENNMREFRGFDEDMPTHGAGSEFGRERREEARRKKYGIIAKKYNPEKQPWIMRVDGKPEKKYKGKKEGLITENSSYYLFTQQADGTFQAIPVDSWYMFQQNIKHQTLNAEEAEEEFIRRDKSFNYFSLMVQKRLKDGTEDPKADEEEKKKAQTKTKSLTILEDDDYRDLMSSGESSSDEEGGKKRKPKKKAKGPSRPKKKDSGSEAEEESDTGDFEGRELDYLSEKSSDEEEEEIKTDIKGLDEELQKIEDEEDELAAEEENKEEEDKKDGEGDNKDGESTKKESSSSGSDSEDSDIDDTKFQSSIFMQKKNVVKKPTQQKVSSKSSSRGGSRPSTPMGSENNKITENTLSGAANKLESPNVSSVKRPGSAEPRTSAKKARTESPVPRPAGSAIPEVGLTEDVVRRYLMRKPMTTKDLLYKLNPKKTGLSSEEVVKRVTTILRKLNPEKRKIKDKMYWHIKDDSKPASR